MRLYDSFTGGLLELPEPPGPIGMYFCGPTVYRRIHVGNAYAVAVLPIWLKRWLEQRGYRTKLVVNVTDINDKIYDAAPGHSADLARDATAWYVEDTDRLGLGRPDVEPRAAETIADQIALVEQLIAAGFAYEAEGDVYYHVARFPDYGRLSRQRVDKMQDEEPDSRKEAPQDFALWKAHKPGEDTQWDSPWGPGRPGWHIECSAMAEANLGPSFEIHGGGLDLKFPHHENEIAQSRALGHPFARIFMHNGMLQFRGEEMHKSVGNDVSLKDALDRWGRETLLLFFMSAHWRKPLDYSDQSLTQARAQVESFRNFFLDARDGDEDGEQILEGELAAVLDDDFNTPEALALFHAWRDREEWASLRWALGLFGLGSIAEIAQAPAEVVALAERRRDARSGKDFAEADRLRGEIEAAGWEARDVADAPGYRLVRKQ